MKRLKEVHAAYIPLKSHQVQLLALDRRPIQSGMVDWCFSNHIKCIAFRVGGVGGGGRLLLLASESLRATVG
jgi:hypothetical protein